MHDLSQNILCLKIQDLQIKRCKAKKYWKTTLSHLISIVIENTNVFSKNQKTIFHGCIQILQTVYS